MTVAMRHTKIVATIGPSSSAPAMIERLIASGVDVFRLNFSHGTHDTHRAAFDAIRAAARRAGRHVAIMQDLSGPKIRTGRLPGGTALALEEGQTLRIAAGDDLGGPGHVYTSYAPLVESAMPGDRLLLDDGKIELKVTARERGELVTEVIDGGPLGEHKGINAPGVALPPDSVTPKDEDDLRLGVELGVDFVALSFVQTPDDCRAARRIAPSIPLIA
ncbi:MAG TPA: pyruvate kinase, partial [Xanthobacteraceae bacterium]|nr:pyruvate kinase [Xanthobacteraceae bacterium]